VATAAAARLAAAVATMAARHESLRCEATAVLADLDGLIAATPGG
jgi:hypothetical protein